jgi:hypothetical protein
MYGKNSNSKPRHFHERHLQSTDCNPKRPRRKHPASSSSHNPITGHFQRAPPLPCSATTFPSTTDLCALHKDVSQIPTTPPPQSTPAPAPPTLPNSPRHGARLTRTRPNWAPSSAQGNNKTATSAGMAQLHQCKLRSRPGAGRNGHRQIRVTPTSRTQHCCSARLRREKQKKKKKTLEKNNSPGAALGWSVGSSSACIVRVPGEPVQRAWSAPRRSYPGKSRCSLALRRWAGAGCGSLEARRGPKRPDAVQFCRVRLYGVVLPASTSHGISFEADHGHCM